MDMFRHNFKFNKLNGELKTHRRNKRLKAQSHVINENLSAVFRTPHDMILTRINDIMIRFILHECIIHIQSR